MEGDVLKCSFSPGLYTDKKNTQTLLGFHVDFNKFLKLTWKIKICKEGPRTPNLNTINGVTHTSHFKHSHSFVEISKYDFNNASHTDQEHMMVISEMDSYVVSHTLWRSIAFTIYCTSKHNKVLETKVDPLLNSFF